MLAAKASQLSETKSSTMRKVFISVETYWGKKRELIAERIPSSKCCMASKILLALCLKRHFNLIIVSPLDKSNYVLFLAVALKSIAAVKVEM